MGSACTLVLPTHSSPSLPPVPPTSYLLTPAIFVLFSILFCFPLPILRSTFISIVILTASESSLFITRLNHQPLFLLVGPDTKCVVWNWKCVHYRGFEKCVLMYVWYICTQWFNRKYCIIPWSTLNVSGWKGLKS